MNLDELIKDNLTCVYESKATDVETKRKHTDLLLQYTNTYLVEKGNGYSSRHRKAAAVRQFYLRNDSPLFGDFVVADGKAGKQRGMPSADDIREVLKALPTEKRTPLVLMWQTGAEPSAVLALKWGDLRLDGDHYKLEFVGRKRHRRPYFKLAGRESIILLKIWREDWRGIIGREPSEGDLVFLGKKRRFSKEHSPVSPGWLNTCFKETAMRLHKQGLVKNGDSHAWHVYVLRHSFSTECSHAEVKPEVREFWMGHVSAISWVYQHPELHEDDFVREYQKVEAYLSLNPGELVTEKRIKAEYDERLARLESEMKELLQKQGRP